MWNTKTTGLAVLMVWFSVWAIYGSEAACYTIGSVTLCGIVVATLKWLKSMETRRFYRLLVLAITISAVSTHSVAMAQMGQGVGGGVQLGDLKTALQSGLGMIMLFGVPTGVVMIIRGIMMDRHDGAWKWEILKGIALAGAPTIINVLYSIFNLGNGGLTPNFN